MSCRLYLVPFQPVVSVNSRSAPNNTTYLSAYLAFSPHATAPKADGFTWADYCSAPVVFDIEIILHNVACRQICL